MHKPEVTYLKEYKKAAYHISKVDLLFEIYEDHVLVENSMQIERIGDSCEPLCLNGKDFELICFKVDGVKLIDLDFVKDSEKVVINDLSDNFEVRVVTKLYPDQNSALEGLYSSQDILCTQNEPEGFRCITYFIDRPDNMSIFTTTIIAQKESYPVLLSNGNLVESTDLNNGTHKRVWHDPFPKPSYLFALVAGELGQYSDSFTTCDGREIKLCIYVKERDLDRTHFAMDALKRAMLWDEREYGLSYDLQIYNIVAVDSFNMGAMENKGLNIFNTQYILADKTTATDEEFLAIESVVAHEYFHNYSGNRVTCRDWFELTLKEGLTVFRDQCFSADMHGSALMRIEDVKRLREYQFGEDSSATAHPIKPDHYIEINNFYTSTVYEKGAEVIRMLYTILGKERWREAMDIYFDRFDAQAVRTDDFLAVVQECSPIDLGQFKLWYTQERTLKIVATHSFNKDSGEMRLKLRQVVPKSVKGRDQKPYLLPMRIAILDKESLVCEKTLYLSLEEEEFVFEGCKESDIFSLNRGFSAPVILEYAQEECSALMRFESDGFAKYEATVRFMQKELLQESLSEQFFTNFEYLLNDPNIETHLKAKLLELPSVESIISLSDDICIEKIVLKLDDAMSALSCRYSDKILHIYNQKSSNTIATRALKNRLLGYIALLQNKQSDEVLLNHYFQSDNMSDKLSAMKLFESYAKEYTDDILDDFSSRFGTDLLVMCKYFSTIAQSKRAQTLERVKRALNHSSFELSIPNHARSLLGTFARNHRYFHAKDGSGYSFICDMIIELDSFNPQLAARLATQFRVYEKLNSSSKRVMHKELDRVKNTQKISKNVFEIVELIIG